MEKFKILAATPYKKITEEALKALWEKNKIKKLGKKTYLKVCYILNTGQKYYFNCLKNVPESSFYINIDEGYLCFLMNSHFDGFEKIETLLREKIEPNLNLCLIEKIYYEPKISSQFLEIELKLKP